MIKNYTSKTIDGFELRFFNNDNSKNNIICLLYKNNKPIGFKNKEGKIDFMESGTNNTSIIKKIKSLINKHNNGESEIVDATLLLEQSENNKFNEGDIIVEKDTNVAFIDDVLYVHKSVPYGDNYTLIKFEHYKLREDNEEDESLKYTVFEKPVSEIDNAYTSIGNDLSIKKLYESVCDLKNAINTSLRSIERQIEDKLRILEKSNEDFYKDLVQKITSDNGLSEFEKDKYIEFVSAAYNNNEKK